MLFSRVQNLLIVCVEFCAAIPIERFARLHCGDLQVVDERSRFWPGRDAFEAAKIPEDVRIVAFVRHPWERFIASIRGNEELLDRRLSFLAESKSAPYLTADRVAGTELPCCPDQVLIGGDSVPRMRGIAETIRNVESFFTGRTADLVRLDNGPEPIGTIAPFVGKRLPNIGADVGSWDSLRMAADALHTTDREQLLRDTFPADYTELGFSPY